MAFYSIERIYSSIELFGYDNPTRRYLIDMKYVANEDTQWYFSNITPKQQADYNR